MPRNTKPRLESARLVRARGGGPIRTIVQGTFGRPTGAFVSIKAGTVLPWEAIDERNFMWICEADFRVTKYLAQPFRMDFFMSDGNRLSYIPDFERTIDDEVEIVEIKKTAAEVEKKSDYAYKLKLARKVCALRGMRFRVVSAEEEIRRQPLLNNVRLVRMHRTTLVTTEDYLRLSEAAPPSGGHLTWGAATAALSRSDDPWDPNGRARLCAMVVRRYVCIDLTLPLDQSRLVFLASHLPHPKMH